MLYFITGPNGGGKSLRAVVMMERLAREGMNVYAYGFDELKIPGVQIHEGVHPADWAELPPNSALFVDEAQKYWRTRRGNAVPPPELLDMEEHRKQGIDIYLVSPSPGFIDNHIKPLVTKHWHCVPYGQSQSRVFEFSECQDNPQGMAKRSHAKFEVWDHPKYAYAWYKSAEAHLKKPGVPWQHRLARYWKLGAALLVAACIWLWFRTPESASVAKAKSGGASLFGNSSEKDVPLSTAAYLEQLRPRVAGMPWSAPAYDGRGVGSEPQVFCISSASSCRCSTEQGTVYVMPMPQCRYTARWGGAYNPFKAANTPAPAAAPAAAPRAEPAGPVAVVAPGDPLQIGSPSMGLVQGK